ncbi:MAG: hypothetical protein JNK46_09490 [Methylobacteriaceae bacterium]|nr:hypothetical protein [Methylobacteriaceae bacterium]
MADALRIAAEAMARAAAALAAGGRRARVVTHDARPQPLPPVALWRAFDGQFAALALDVMRTVALPRGVRVEATDESLFVAGLPALAAEPDGDDLRLTRLTIDARSSLAIADAGRIRLDGSLASHILTAVKPLLAEAPAPVSMPRIARLRPSFDMSVQLPPTIAWRRPEDWR